MVLEEQETNINYMAAEDESIVYTSYLRDLNRFKRLIERFPDNCKVLRQTEESIIVKIPKKWIKISPPREMTEEQREACRERLKNMHEKRKQEG